MKRRDNIDRLKALAQQLLASPKKLTPKEEVVEEVVAVEGVEKKPKKRSTKKAE
jgi:hypothetical protein